MKPLRETKLGQWLKLNSPKVFDTIGDVLPDRGVLGIIKNIISKDDSLSPEIKAQQLAALREFEKEIFAMELEDRDNARDMQKAALAQDDKFSKRYVYYLSSFVIASASSFGVMLFFVDFPESNRRLIEMFADIYLFAGAIMVLQFFFGSSQSSHNKDKLISQK